MQSSLTKLNRGGKGRPKVEVRPGFGGECEGRSALEQAHHSQTPLLQSRHRLTHFPTLQISAAD